MRLKRIESHQTLRGALGWTLTACAGLFMLAVRGSPASEVGEPRVEPRKPAFATTLQAPVPASGNVNDWFPRGNVLDALARRAPSSRRLNRAAPNDVPAPHHPSRVLIRLNGASSRGAGDVREAVALAGTVLRTYPDVPGLALIELHEDTVADAIAALRRDPAVLYAEPDYVISANATPNDPGFPFQWPLLNVGQDADPDVLEDPGTPGADIRAVTAWNISTGDPDFRIAILDTGLDFTHPDLQDNVWTNPREIPGNGLDDDANGWVDDVHGYDFVNNDGDPADDSGHGTHVAGILGAAGNNGQGIAGVNWRCQIVPLKVLNAGGNGLISDVIRALEYATQSGIRLSNNSWGYAGPFSNALSDAIEAAGNAGHLFIAAAGNLFGRDLDVAPVYPASLDLSNIVSVTATDNDDRLGFFADIGVNSVDLAAPGTAVLSTVPDDQYFALSGTSMAAPHVTGVAALLMGRRPDLDIEAVKFRILRTARPVASLKGLTLTGGVVNAAAAVGDCNLNGVADELDIAAGTSVDCDFGGIPDECEPDCDANGVMDDCDLAAGTHSDCNANQVPDVCDVTSGVAADCNRNGVPDPCDLTDGTSSDVNRTGVPDECEACNTAADCDDGNVCTLASCVEGVCFSTNVVGACDDGNDCTGSDTCTNGVCAGYLLASPECAPIFSLRATARNEVPLTSGPTDRVTVLPGDRLTVELFVRRWQPERVLAYNAVIDWTGYTSGATGFLEPVREPSPDAGAFIDINRPDFVFYNQPVLSLVWNTDLDFYQYASLVILGSSCASDPARPAYLGTLRLAVSATASGQFTLCLNENTQDSSFLLDCPDAVHLPPAGFECLTIDVPLGECSQEPDCNANGAWDICDIAAGDSRDCNRNDVPDECDLAGGLSADCNTNGVPDECDTRFGGVSDDCDRNRVPDECQPDCNANGLADPCDLQNRTSLDCNANTVPDECDIAFGTSTDCVSGLGNGIPDECEPDCNDNQIADSCDFALGNSVDLDGNGIPDDCLQVRRVPQAYPTIQSAVDAAAPGDLVLLAPGLHTGPGNAAIDFRGKVLTVRGAGRAEECVIAPPPDQVGFFFRSRETPASRIENLTISGALYGMVLDRDAAPTIRGCRLIGNLRGGVACSPGSPVVEDCLISDTQLGRGVLALFNSHVTLRRCRIVDNRGGGVYVRRSRPLIESCLIADHRRGLIGSGVRLDECDARIINCTITNNDGFHAPALHVEQSTVTVVNSILWNNRVRLELAEEGQELWRMLPSSILTDYSVLTASYSIVQGGPAAVGLERESVLRWGSGMLDAPPAFVADEGIRSALSVDLRNRRLTANSPGLDSGAPMPAPGAGSWDLDRHARQLCGRIDMGAYEFGIGDVNCDRSVDRLDWSAWDSCARGPHETPLDASCLSFDLNGDGDVDFQDAAGLLLILWPEP